ncbi:mechanosensitive ion channel family protein [Methanocella sp. MCL-LM]|uniref:mechanosensitive ion channel family protein n=1 Tax=Methanocella sp. MCL-LM TaxID=3412035 RepID=UPI003C72382C
MQELGATLSGNGTEAVNSTAATNSSAMTGFSIDVHPLADPIQAFITATTGASGLMADVATAAVIIVIFTMLSEVARYFVKNIAPKLVKHTSSSLDDELLAAIKNPIAVLFLATGVYLAVKSMDNLSSGLIETLDHTALATLVLVIAYFVSNLLSALLRWYSRDVAPHTDSDLDDHLIPFAEKMISVVVYLLALLIILSAFGIEITALVASMGIASLAVALAAQESLSNIFGAVAILMDRPYKVGDRLHIPGIGQGDVLDIGMRSTRVMTRTRQVIVIPNKEMANTEIVNLSLPDSRLRLQLTVGVAYKADIDRACKVLEEIAGANELVLKDPKPSSYVSSLGDFAVQITLLVWIADYRQDLDVPDQIYRQILARFKEEDIEISYPVMTVLPRAA